MLMYENFLNNILNPLNVKFASAIVDFLNIVNPNVNWNYERRNDDILIYADSDIVFLINKLKFKGVYEFTCNPHYNNNYLMLDKSIINFILYAINKEYVSLIDVNISDIDIPNYIKNLTKENYDDYLIKITANKFNL